MRDMCEVQNVKEEIAKERSESSDQMHSMSSKKDQRAFPSGVY